MLMKERFVPLIHINCPSQIKCQQCISVVSSASIQKLHIVVIQALAEVSSNNKEFFNINTPNFINSLIKLAEFKFNNDTNFEEDNQSLKIRNESKQCLDSIHSWGDEQAQVELVTNGYPRILVNIINTAGGNEQEQEGRIYQGLWNIFNFIGEILKGRETDPDYGLFPSFPPQPVLFKSCQEQIEDEGGNEEMEAQLVNKRKGEYDDINNRANFAKRRILNIFVDNSNPKLYWYNW
ncbi:MAG: hypothetical protein EZS28_044268 [Streblomastix strix]|uniref:Uncharacterized protein n=1 Tax=Streblomastix strix TaxID=222440 RepID=A0A5J4TS60_9EUKA|nr:MAG: hypothetical protein EZS28_044268 [Streblomastix strix]